MGLGVRYDGGAVTGVGGSRERGEYDHTELEVGEAVWVCMVMELVVAA